MTELEQVKEEVHEIYCSEEFDILRQDEKIDRMLDKIDYYMGLLEQTIENLKKQIK